MSPVIYHAFFLVIGLLCARSLYKGGKAGNDADLIWCGAGLMFSFDVALDLADALLALGGAA